jgi:hypothetical protein
VNSNLRQFIVWASERLQQPTLTDAQIELVVGKPSPDQAAHLTIETNELIGRLIYWERGSAHAQVLPVANEPHTDDRHWDMLRPEDFSMAFRPFVSRFFEERAAD